MLELGSDFRLVQGWSLTSRTCNLQRWRDKWRRKSREREEEEDRERGEGESEAHSSTRPLLFTRTTPQPTFRYNVINYFGKSTWNKLFTSTSLSFLFLCLKIIVSIRVDVGQGPSVLRSASCHRGGTHHTGHGHFVWEHYSDSRRGRLSE